MTRWFGSDKVVVERETLLVGESMPDDEVTNKMARKLVLDTLEPESDPYSQPVLVRVSNPVAEETNKVTRGLDSDRVVEREPKLVPGFYAEDRNVDPMLFQKAEVLAFEATRIAF